MSSYRLAVAVCFASAVTAIASGCAGDRVAGGSVAEWVNDPAASVVGESASVCESGFRILDRDAYSAKSAGGSYGPASDRVAYVYELAFYHPAFCNEISDDEVTNAARRLVDTVPEICSGIPEDKSTRSEPFAEAEIFAQWPTELIDRAIREFIAQTGGGPVGSGDTEGGVNQSAASRRNTAEYAVQAAALQFCPGY
ncbi:hypothetical protein [Nocardia cyriacigeorgica]|uniref:hypothetical protein n=1 Tax=Nocardia cyriacigeorgica TaxID=135487 RepID=UPI0024544AFB|nr:hypothetical protein [Nocardia cyriacigeorgica]